jgi:hypothetical protein
VRFILLLLLATIAHAGTTVEKLRDLLAASSDDIKAGTPVLRIVTSALGLNR